MKIILHIGILLLLLFFMQGCISDYNPEVPKNFQNILVVEGIITEGTTSVRLMRSVGLGASNWVPQTVDDADVSVECDNGTTYKAIPEVKKGVYKIQIDRMDREARYRLRILTDGKEYESEYLQPLVTPEMDAVEFIKEGKDQPVRLCVSTHGADDQGRYYSWSYDEIWETEAINGFLVKVTYNEKGELVRYTPEHPWPYRYCWHYQSSKPFLFVTTENLSWNVVDRKELAMFASSDARFSIMYYINLRQNLIRKKAYEYFMHVKANSESAGDLFSPIPMELPGNIRCVDNVKTPVIGYIEVSITTGKEIFIPYPNDLYVSQGQDCYLPPTAETPVDYMLYDTIGGIPHKMLNVCLDCRKTGGTKNKPDFWPTDHD